MAATSGAPAIAQAASNAVHHAAGSCSLRGGVVTGWWARPSATSAPVSASRISTLVDCVEESTPATSGMGSWSTARRAVGYRTPSSSSVTSWSRRSWP